MTYAKSLYEQAVAISTDYLGPTGERFLRRQIETHLNKPPENLTKRDIQKLTEWVKLTFALLTQNEKLVEEFANDLRSLGSNASTRPKEVQHGRYQ